MVTGFLLSYAVLMLSCTTIALPSTPSSSNETDRLALLAFKAETTDGGGGSLSSWNDTVDFCLWHGITCKQRRVTALLLPSEGLSGFLSPQLGNLTSLRELNLGDNGFRGEIPSQLGNLAALADLNLSSNSLAGTIPANLSRCVELQYLDLAANQLAGPIPAELTASLYNLMLIQLQSNNLTGAIPPSIGNLSSLYSIALGRNSLVGGIPDTIGRLSGMEYLQIAENRISGPIPESIYNLSSLTFVTVADNRLQGRLPPDLGRLLPKLETLYTGNNLLAGTIPASIVNASGIMNLDLAYNHFTGSVPADIGRLSRLNWLNFEYNRLGIGLDFLDSLINCSYLEVLDISSNGFEGPLPTSVANLSAQLSMLIVGGNEIGGSIPQTIDNLSGLSVLRMEQNLLSGGIPSSVGRLRNLQMLSLFGNNLSSGRLPSSIGNLTLMSDLRLGGNGIQGSIPPSLGNCTSLQLLELMHNRLNGAIPPEVIGISALTIVLNLNHNLLSGFLPKEVGDLVNLRELDVSGNRLIGKIPESLGNCKSMEYLHLQGNMFGGSIPDSLDRLKGIAHVDLSNNNLTGGIPGFLATIRSLKYLNLSNNDLAGAVPRDGVFANASGVSVAGNRELCGGLPSLRLQSCRPVETSNGERGNKGIIRIAVPIVCAVAGIGLIACLLAALHLERDSKNPPPVTSFMEEPNIKVSYRDLFEATDGFSSANMIGEGSYGKVYKGILGTNRTVVAVKVLNLQHRGASKSFVAECDALGRQVRHRNLIKIVTSCSSVDPKGDDFKALVYEFMPNGSLEEWLHGGAKNHSKVLNIIQRLNISIDVASALDYLHHQCQVPIAHCDLKPSNILLDDEMNAHVGDFGLAKILLNDESSRIQSESIAIKGSIGYVPPEYGMRVEVSIEGDVYSYGILLLEMFTGKRPTDDGLGEGLSLRDVVISAHPEKVMGIADSQLLLQRRDQMREERDMNSTSRIEECLVSVIGIGLSCSAPLPRDRMRMGDVVAKLHSTMASIVEA